MKCRVCGKELEDDVTFCYYCGASLGDDSGQTTDEEGQEKWDGKMPKCAGEAQSPPKEERSSVGGAIKKVAIVLAVLSMIGSITIGVVYGKAVPGLGIGIAFGGIVVSVLGGLLVYGFGEIIALLTSIDNKL